MQIQGIRKEESIMPYKGTVIQGKPFLTELLETPLVSHSIPVIHKPKPRHNTDSLARLSRHNSRDHGTRHKPSLARLGRHNSRGDARLNSRGSAYKASLLKYNNANTQNQKPKNLQTIRPADSTEPAADDKLTVQQGHRTETHQELNQTHKTNIQR